MRNIIGPRPQDYHGPGRPRSRPDITEGKFYTNPSLQTPIYREVLGVIPVVSHRFGFVKRLTIKYRVSNGFGEGQVATVSYASFYAWAREEVDPAVVAEAARFIPPVSAGPIEA